MEEILWNNQKYTDFGQTEIVKFVYSVSAVLFPPISEHLLPTRGFVYKTLLSRVAKFERRAAAADTIYNY